MYVSISGFGEEGPYTHKKVYDNVIQAYSGLAAVQADPATGEPAPVRNLVADKLASQTAAQAITAALFARDRGAGGQHVTLSMLDSVIAFLWPDAGVNQMLLEHEGADIKEPPARQLRYAALRRRLGDRHAALRRRVPGRVPRARPPGGDHR